ncbi:DUF202 domain-containing protein [Nocardia sp. CWNU-33]|uniref:DUF202 domain-containing protein n=1 Tax=Nocardia sp. CWNU-33 TaxID=3392117 RepID=UPI00398EF862
MAEAGLAIERTALAWRRTAASACVVTVLLIRHAIESGRSPGGAVALTVAVAMSSVALVGWRRNAELRRGATQVRAAPMMTTVSVLIATAMAALMLVSPPLC